MDSSHPSPKKRKLDDPQSSSSPVQENNDDINNNNKHENNDDKVEENPKAETEATEPKEEEKEEIPKPVGSLTTIMGCRSVDNFHKLNKIEEGNLSFLLFLSFLSPTIIYRNIWCCV